MGFQILDARDPWGCHKWLEYWNSWEDREVFAHPAYVRLFCRKQDKAMCAAYLSGDTKILFPFILRDLVEEPWVVEAQFRGLHDIITPYGYGGAFRLDGNSEQTSFWSEFGRWAVEQNVVSMFMRMSLFSDQLEPFEGQLRTIGENIVVQLMEPLDIIIAGYKHKVRTNVDKARRNGLYAIVDYNGEFLSSFLEIYYQTMDRNKAKLEYYFPRSFFQEVIDNLPGQYVFFHISDGDEILSTELVLLSAHRAYSYLGGTKAESFPLRPNDLLKHEIIVWGKNRGLRQLVLGGGYAPNDGIYRYKKSFASYGGVDFCVGTKVFSTNLYEALVTSRYSYERKRGSIGMANGYFPEYRAPIRDIL
jgi:hypothetical protein